MATTSIADSVDTRPRTTSVYAWYVTAALMCAYVLSVLDRQVVSLLVGPIKADLGLTDTQFAIVTGGAFGIFYTLMGLPIGWLADRFDRKWIIATGIALWSGMTALCGFASSFAQFFLARLGVGVGEAALSPSAYSMLSDYFNKERLPRAMSIYAIGIFIGAGMAMLVGSQVIAELQHAPLIQLPVIGSMPAWKAVFPIVGLPGVLIALWFATIREPKRSGHTEMAPFGEVFRFIGRYPAMYSAFFLGTGLATCAVNADAWYPELFIRTWGWDAVQAGRVLGISSLLLGPLGLIFIGWYASYKLRQGMIDACLRLTVRATVILAAAVTLMPLMPSPKLMILLLVPIKLCSGMPMVLIPAAMQAVAPNRLRAQIGSIFIFCVGILGLSAAPIVPAVLTDFVFKDESSLHYSLAASSLIVGPLAVLILRSGLKQYREVLAAGG